MTNELKQRFDTKVRAIFDVSATSENEDSPKFCVVDLTDALIADVKRLSAMCDENSFMEIRVNSGGYIEQWGCDAQMLDFLHLQNECVVVQPRGLFRFSATPKSTDYAVDTPVCLLTELQAKLEEVRANPQGAARDASGAAVVVVGDYEGNLLESYFALEDENAALQEAPRG